MRRVLMAILAIVSATIVLIPASATPAPVPSWVHWSHQPAHDQGLDIAVSPDGRWLFTTGLAGPDKEADVEISSFDALTGLPRWSTDVVVGTHAWTNGIAVTADGIVLVLMQARSEARGLDYTVAAFQASDGAELWADRFDGPAHRDDVSGDLVLSADGSAAYVVGTLESGRQHGPDLAVASIATDSGSIRWTTTYNGPRSRRATRPWDGGRTLALSDDGRTLFVTGVSSFHVADRGVTIVTLALDATSGDRIWKHRGPIYGCSYADPQAIAAMPDGPVVVTGVAVDGCENASFIGYVTMAYDPDDGSEVWQDWTTEYSGDQLGGRALEATSDGREVVQTGVEVSLDYETAPDFGTIAYGPDGTVRWWDDFDGSTASMPAASDEASDLAIVPGSEVVVVTGRGQLFTVTDDTYTGSQWDILTVAYSAEGELLWSSRYADPSIGDDVQAEAIVADPRGGAVFIVGSGLDAAGELDQVVLSYRV